MCRFLQLKETFTPETVIIMTKKGYLRHFWEIRKRSKIKNHAKLEDEDFFIEIAVAISLLLGQRFVFTFKDTLAVRHVATFTASRSSLST